MPRIQDALLDSVIYLYPSPDAANAGQAIGGSGFLIYLESKVHPGYGFPYAVTNSHVIREAHSPVVRLNTKDGKKAIAPLDEDAWVHHPTGDDLAVIPMPLTDTLRYHMVSFEQFCITPEFIAENKIGPGDEVYMVGRFVNHEGRQQNAPSVRFGAIAQMNIEPILHERGHWQESFLIEGRSIPGYSGSPVFLWLDLSQPRPFQGDPNVIHLGGWVTRLLGVDWCHLGQDWPVLDKVNEEVADDDGHTPGYHIRANTGMMGVVPAWKIWDVLNEPKLVDQRAEAEEQIAKQKAASPASLDGKIAT